MGLLQSAIFGQIDPENRRLIQLGYDQRAVAKGGEVHRLCWSLKAGQRREADAGGIARIAVAQEGRHAWLRA